MKRERVCKQWGCRTILSRFNKSPYCHVHRFKRLMTKEEEKKKRKAFAWKQLTDWADTKQKLAFATEHFRIGQWCYRKKKFSDGIKYAVFIKSYEVRTRKKRKGKKK